MLVTGDDVDRLQDEAEQLRERARFYEMEAEHAPPPPVDELEAQAARLKRLADQVEGEAEDVLKAKLDATSRRDRPA